MFSDGGRVVEDKMLNAVIEQGSFVTAFTGDKLNNVFELDCSSRSGLFDC